MPSHLNLKGKGLLVVNTCSRSGHFFVINNIRSWTGKIGDNEHIFWNMENYFPRKVSHEMRKINPQDLKNSVRILQLRDLLNWIASTVQRRMENRGPNFLHRWDPVQSIGVWMAIAQEFYGETAWLGGFTKVSYEAFFQSEEYRRHICRQVGGHTTRKTSTGYQPMAGGAASMAWTMTAGPGRWMYYTAIGRYP